MGELESFLNSGQVVAMLRLFVATIRGWVMLGFITHRKIGTQIPGMVMAFIEIAQCVACEKTRKERVYYLRSSFCLAGSCAESVGVRRGTELENGISVSFNQSVLSTRALDRIVFVHGIESEV